MKRVKPGSCCVNHTHVGAEYTGEELEFLKAIDAAKRRWGPFLTPRQILRVAAALGYRKATPPHEPGPLLPPP